MTTRWEVYYTNKKDGDHCNPVVNEVVYINWRMSKAPPSTMPTLEVVSRRMVGINTTWLLSG